LRDFGAFDFPQILQLIFEFLPAGSGNEVGFHGRDFDGKNLCIAA
jgi:hypothetical protein